MTILLIAIGVVLGITLYKVYNIYELLKIKQVVTKGYYYTELPDEDTKKRARVWAQTVLAEDNYYLDDVTSDYKLTLETNGYVNPQLNYSISYSQGDGASFTCTTIDILKWIKAKIYINELLKQPVDVLLAQALDHITNNNVEIVVAYIKRTDTHYSHENTVSVKLEWNYTNKVASTDHAVIDKIFNHLEALISLDIIQRSKDLYQDLLHAYENATSDTACIEYVDNNMIWFDVKGNFLKR